MDGTTCGSLFICAYDGARVWLEPHTCTVRHVPPTAPVLCHLEHVGCPGIHFTGILHLMVSPVKHTHMKSITSYIKTAKTLYLSVLSGGRANLLLVLQHRRIYCNTSPAFTDARLCVWMIQIWGHVTAAWTSSVFTSLSCSTCNIQRTITEASAEKTTLFLYIQHICIFVIIRIYRSNASERH